MSIAVAPPRLEDHLRPIEHHGRDLLLIRGLGATLIAVAVPLAVWLIGDLFLNFPAALRGVGLLGIVVYGGWTAWKSLIRPLWRGIDQRDVAAWLEESQPRLQERLLTCLELDAGPAPSSRTARIMQRQVQRETWSLLEETDVADVLPPDRAYRTLGLGMLASAVAIAPFVIWLSGYGLGWQRLALPAGNWGWGRNFRIVSTDVPLAVALGKDATIRAEVTPRRGGLALPDELTLAWRPVGSSQWDERRLPRGDDEAYAAVLPRLSVDTEFVVKGPAAVSPSYIIRAVDPPQLTALSVEVDAPAYTGQPSQHGPVGRELQVYLGSRIRWRATFDRPVASVELDWPQLAPPAAGDAAGNTSSVSSTATVPWSLESTKATTHNTATAASVALTSGEFVVRWVSPEGFEVAEPPRRLVVIPDQTPLVRIEGPATLTVRPNDRQPLHITAGDDYRLTTAELHIDLSPEDRRVVPLPLTAESRRSADWNLPLDLADLGVRHGQALSLRVRVIDNCEFPGPQESWTDPQLLVVSTSAPASDTRELAEQTQTARRDLQELMREFAAQRDELRQVHQKTAAATVKQRDPQQEEQLAKLEQAQQQLNQRFQEWQDQLPQDGAWEHIEKLANDLQAEELDRAEEGLAEARAAEPRERIETLSQTLDELAAAERELQRLDDEIRALGNLGDELNELARLANDTERLAERLNAAANQAQPLPADEPDPNGDPAANPADNAAALAEATQAAEQIRQELSNLIASEPELAAAIAKFQRQQAAAVAERLSELAAEQRAAAEGIQNVAEAQQERDNTAVADATQPANGNPQPQADFEEGMALADELNRLQQQAASVAEQVAAAATEQAAAAAADTPPAANPGAGENPNASQPAAPAANPAAEAPPANPAVAAAQETADQAAAAAAAARAGDLEAAAEALAAAGEQNAVAQAEVSPATPDNPNAPANPNQGAAADPAANGDPAANPAPGTNPGAPSGSNPGANPAANPANPGTNPAQPGANPSSTEIAEALEDLASEIAALQEELSNAASNPQAQRGALADSERRLTEAVEELQAALPQNPANGPSGSDEPPSGSPLAGVAGELEQAMEAMQNAQAALLASDDATAGEQATAAAEQLERTQERLQPAQGASHGQPAPAAGRLPTQAGENLADASQRLADANQQLQQAAGSPANPQGTPMPGTPGENAPSAPNAPSPSNASSSSATPSKANSSSNGTPAASPNGPASLAELAQQYQQAAEALRQAARSANGNRSSSMAQQSSPNNPQAASSSQGGNDPNENPSAATASLEGANSRALSGAERAWGRLEGTLNTTLLDGAVLGKHPEYREQIRRYFETVAGNPGATESAPPARSP